MNLRRAPHPAIATGAIIAAGFVFSGAEDWPGFLSYDSVLQLLEGRARVYADWHPPVMSWLLGLFDALVPGAGLFALFDAVLVFGALLLLLMLVRRPSWAAAGVAALLTATPQLLIYPAIVWKDVLFAAASVAGFASLAAAARFWPRPAVRFAALGGSGALFVLAALARQNGIVMLLFAAFALAWIAARQADMRAGLSYGAGGLALALALAGAGHWALGSRVRGGTGPAAQIRLLQDYDLIGALARDPALPLPHIARAAPRLARLMRSDGVRLYSPRANDTLERSPALIEALGAAPDGAVAADWLGLVLGHPLLYLRMRWAAFRWVFLPPAPQACHPYYLGVDGPSAAMAALGLARRWDGRDQALASYAHRFLGTPILSHGFYALLAAAGVVLFLRRRRPADIAMAGLCAAALAFAASFFVISIACDYRYLYALDLAAMAALFYAALEPGTLLRPAARP